MSVYNGEKFLKECIDSVRAQTYPEFEFIITDDCSTDGTWNILKKYQEKDERIILLKNTENRGLTRNLNTMVSLAKGELIARMDADDIAMPDRLEKEHAIFEQFPTVEMVFTDIEIIDDRSDKICNSWRPETLEKILGYLDRYIYIVHPSVMMRRDFFSRYGMYDEAYTTGQDSILWKKAYREGAEFYYLKETLLKYRINPKSVRRNNRENNEFLFAKTCLVNADKKAVWKYFKPLSNVEKLQIFIRMCIPFLLYRHILYANNRIRARK